MTGILVGCDGHGALHVVAAFPHGQVVDDAGALADDIAAALAKHGIKADFSEGWTEPFGDTPLPEYSGPRAPCMLWIHSEPAATYRERYEQVCASMDARRVA